MALTNSQAKSGPLLCVILPVHNVAATLDETIQSLFAQTEPRWEAILVDDGSTDATPRLIRDFVARDARIRSITLTKQGVSKAMNVGIEASRAERVMFLDGDDWLAPHYIERMLGALAAHPHADIVYCGFFRVHPEGWTLPVEFVPEVAKRPFEALSARCAFASHSVVLPRQLLLDLGGFDTALVTSEDWDLWQRVARTGARFVGVPEGLAYYRARPGSATSRYLQMIADLKDVMGRVQAPDPRVKTPHPRYANGIQIPHPERRLLASALLLAGVECVNGRPGAPALDPLEPLPDCVDLLEDNCSSLVHGLTFTRPAATVPQVWDVLEPHLLAVCARIQNASSPGVDVQAMIRRIAGRILEQCDLTLPVTLGRLHAQTLDLGRALPPLTLPQSADHLYLRLLYRGKPLEDICVAASGSLSPAALQGVILGALGLHRGPLIWLRLPCDFALRTARTLRAVLLSRQNRKARLLGVMQRLSANFAASVHLLARS